MCYVRLFRPHPSLARKLLAVFLPPPGGRLWGGAWLYVMPLNNGDPACRGRGRWVVHGVMYYARLFRPHPSLRATFPTRGKATTAVS